MPQYKLIYFNGRGRAENTRMALEYAGIKYEDVRLEGGAFAEYKPKSPFGQLPVLEIDGEKIAQSNAILRYVAREAGLAGKSSIESLKVDMHVDTVEEITSGMSSWSFAPDEKKKEEIYKTVFEGKIPTVLGRFEEIVENNKSGFSVGSSLTVSDIAIANALFTLQNLQKDFNLKKYPHLLALQKKVHNLPRIKEWIQKRPSTPF